MPSYKEITTQELIGIIAKNKSTIIDTRAVEAYNGWILKGEKRGGHISGAKAYLPNGFAISTGLKLSGIRASHLLMS